MRFGHNSYWVIVCLSRSLRLKNGDVIYSSFERVEEFDEKMSHGKMVEFLMDVYSNEIDSGWAMLWKIVSKREAEKFKAKEFKK